MKVLIVGAGTGGLAAAVATARAWRCALFQPAGRLGTALRDATLRLPASWMADSQGWLYDYDAATQ